jgi:excisionase family DNA binding protein
MTTEPKLLRVEDAARLLSLGRSKAYELVAAGELPVVRIGRSVRVPAMALDQYVARLATEAKEDGGGTGTSGMNSR